ncbi:MULTISPECIES: uracil phosphoribosyltransferase [Caldilinea]|uniref:Uracil phosphoribosyltransferase n=1 Tax=Caldilinea aerophila (strain DSM 14535 / JCM 11387 / NBRC 104270 / STL-6-O1) TaxID=926550 RepID=I0I9V2_CALAS|nr:MULTISPECIES: uracil phosphoribosyltransferase [Caldilinea]MBO9394401.1 uracil phosphoribosyltransferase [Caldilinea sp.]BAM02040.1 uracil phosphoribosyltransferase [Caldilinea aerophila DSM 14535 = NBRC 104270]GIV75239.1 MAG: uracil phosphoribosyltransferase [Caldilinea sp.]
MWENVFVSSHPLAQHKLTLLRRRETEPKKFREVIGELAMMLIYEASQDLAVRVEPIETPLTATQGSVMAEKIGFVPILRAGLGMVEGAWKLLPQAEVWHLGFYRDERTLRPVAYYNKLPVAPTVDLCMILDPMLATGGSAIAAVDVLKRWGVSRIKFIGLLAAPEGIRALHAVHPDVAVHVAAVDERLTGAGDSFPPGYIWPGLGDAGDRQFGTA